MSKKLFCTSSPVSRVLENLNHLYVSKLFQMMHHKNSFWLHHERFSACPQGKALNTSCVIMDTYQNSSIRFIYFQAYYSLLLQVQWKGSEPYRGQKPTPIFLDQGIVADDGFVWSSCCIECTSVDAVLEVHHTDPGGRQCQVDRVVCEGLSCEGS